MIGQVMKILTRNVEQYSDFNSLEWVKRIPKRKIIQKIEGLGYENNLLLQDNGIVYMKPHNDGMPTCPFVWHRETEDLEQSRFQKIIDNQNDFTQIQNISTILNKTVDVMRESYEKKQTIAPFLNFGIELTDKIQPDYAGNGELVLVTGNFLSKMAKNNPKKASAHFTNVYLDMFIGWNYGDVIRNESDLKANLLDLNQRLIKDGTRNLENATGFEVCTRGKVDCFYDFPKK